MPQLWHIHLQKTFLLTIGFCLIFTLQAFAATQLTQRDWMVALVDTLGLSFGLPDEPQDPDYINLLLGSRSFRFEAESVYTPEEDEVSLMTFNNFGPFSGEGWLQGLNESNDLHLRFVLPLSGTYQLFAAIRHGPHHFDAGGKQWIVNGKENFTRVKVGEIYMGAGPQEVLVKLPPGGAIDYIEMIAPSLPPIMPGNGWEPDDPLDWEDLQTTLLQVFNLAELLAIADKTKIYEAETFFSQANKNVSVVDISHFGSPSGGSWIRADVEESNLIIPVNLPRAGFYKLSIRMMGHPVQVSINNHYTTVFDAKNYLVNLDMGPFYFFSGDNEIRFTLPAGGGIDQITFTPLTGNPNIVANLLGLPKPSASLTQDDFNHLVSLLAAFGTTR